MKTGGKGQGWLEGQGLEVGARLGAGEKAGKVTLKDQRDQEWVGEEQEEGGDGLRAGGPESGPYQGRCAHCQVCPSPSSRLNQAAN